ncbi:MAG: exosome 3'-_5 exonuclease subunit ski4 (Csl4) [Sclerophora amabilis]|nr:MAG: exosome 3'->5 exonuclease subunit ski4 (Csl4) [Sclerophora amabilis]
MAAFSIVIPGQILGPRLKQSAGPGTHIHGGSICASISGLVVNDDNPPSSAARTGNTPNDRTPGAPKESITSSSSAASIHGTPTLSIPRTASTITSETNTLPEVDSVVLARVTRINPRQATVAILVIGEAVCAEGFQGVIRVQDVRATEKDKVKIFASFRPGDIVRAQVVSLGDQSNYYLSTAHNHFGVVMATSEAGNPMYPISWKEFKDPVTAETESRKVAKPF